MVDVVWHAPAFGGYGYAKVSRNSVIELDRLGVNVYLKPNYLWDLIEPSRINPSILNRLKQLAENKVDEDNAITISHALAPSYVSKGRYRIGFTYWESDRLSPKWVDHMNNDVDEVWTGSHFCKAVFERSGVRKPVQVMPAGVDPEKFNHNVKPVNIKNKKGFTFLTVLDWGPRKNPHTLIRAYYKAFNENDDVCLFIKIWGLGSFGLDKLTEIRTIKDSLGLKGKPPKIIWHTGYIDDDDLPRLYRGCDAFVLPTKGEGFCLPLIEAMASGLPVIATNWSGHTDYMSEWNSYPIRVKGFVPVKYDLIPHYLGFESRWAEPDEDHLAELMRYVYEHREEAREKGLKGMKHVHRHFRWRQAGEKILKRLEKIEAGRFEEEEVKVSLVVPSSEDYDLHWDYLSFKDKRILDLGADQGSTASWFLRKGAKEVIAVEGDHNTALQLIKNAVSTQVKPVELMIRDKQEIISLIEEYKPDLVKVDIEGSEVLLLDVNDEVLRRVSEWLIEAHDSNICEKMKAKFSQSGFQVKVRSYWPVWIIIATIETLSLNLIVKDDEASLKECLEKARDVNVDEIVIVVDSRSTDRSEEIAKEYGAKVVKAEWHDSFSEHRNIAIDHSSGDWILVLDADEELESKLKESLRSLINTDNYDAYYFPRRNLVTPQIYPDRQIRLFKRGSGRWVGRVHEYLDIPKHRTSATDLHIIHKQEWMKKSSETQNERNAFYQRLQEMG